MTRAVFTSPGIIVHFPELPGAQCLNRHKIGENNFTLHTGKASLQYIAAAQVALRSRNCTIGRSNLKVPPSVGIQQPAEDGRAIEVRQTTPVYRTIRSNQHYRMTISDDAIGINRLIISSNGFHYTPSIELCNLRENLFGQLWFPLS